MITVSDPENMITQKELIIEEFPHKINQIFNNENCFDEIKLDTNLDKNNLDYINNMINK